MTGNSSCTNTENELSFSNTDHLEWNQKKHDMILNLGLTNNSETDQTPTPTRFIRNCEEVGLFQDLQNVNPFDEVFKKAVENPTAINLQIPVSTPDDTLHTPQIYPQLEDSSKIPNNTVSVPNDYSLSGVISSIDQRDDGDNPLIIVLDPENDNVTSSSCDKDKSNTTSQATTSLSNEINLTNNTKEKIKAAIIQKSDGVTPVPIDKLLDHEKHDVKDFIQNQIDISELIRQREANKAAQSRCRKRKQKEFEEMKAENKLLKQENNKLKTMNVYLQKTINKLEENLKEATTSTRPPAVMTDNQPCIDERISAVSIHQISAETNPNEMLKTPEIVSAPEGRTSQSIQNTFTQHSSTTLHNSVSPNCKIPPAILNNQGNTDKIPLTNVPKTVVLALPVQNMNNAIGIPLQNIQNSSNTVVFVYPQISDDPTNSNSFQKSSFKRIMPK